MEPRRSGRAVPHGPARSSDAVYAGVTVVLLFAVWCAQALEVSVGKVPHIEAMNGSTVLLPCSYSSCFGIKNLYFSWSYNDNGTMVKLCHAVIPAEGVEPNVRLNHDRVEFVGKAHNISILLYNITFEDEGEYICFARNPKEKNRNHSAIYRLYVVEELKVVDKTLTTIIMSVVGGLIGLIVLVMILKALILFALRKMREKNKECLVSSSGNDNTENGLTGSKADNKATPKTTTAAPPVVTVATVSNSSHKHHCLHHSQSRVQ